MEYVYYSLGAIFIIYVLVTFKKHPNDTPFNRYYNSKYYRLVLVVIGATIAGIIMIFTKKN